MALPPDTTPEKGTAPRLESSANRTYLIGVAFLLVAILFIMASPLDWYGAFKTIHVVFAVIWIGGGFLLTALAFIAEQENDAEGRLIVARQAARVSEVVFTPSSLIVLVFGIAMMLNDTGEIWDWGSFWVSFGLLGFVATFAIGIGVLSPTAKKIRGLVESVGPNAPEVHAEMTKIFLFARIDAAVLMLVVVDMVAKPFL